MNELLDRYRWQFILSISLILGILLPFVVELVSLNPAWRFGLFLLVVNGFWSAWVGKLIKPLPYNGIWLFAWPVCFLIGNWLFYPKYSYIFALVYLGISYMVYGKESPVK